MIIRTLLIGISLLFSPLVADARIYDASVLPYSDAPTDRATAIAVSVLTEEGIVRGNPDGTFLPNRALNRAEFLMIAMALHEDDAMAFSLGCFPDVLSGAWYEVVVCKAKAAGFVRGNVVSGTPASQWLFEPERSVQYEEAVKMLVEILGMDLPSVSGEWYEPYLQAARLAQIDLEGRRAGDVLTRGEMARLVVAFLAYHDGELDELRAAERGDVATSSSSDSSVSSNSSNSSVSSVSSDSSVYDLDFDVSTRARFILLGQVSPVVGAAKVMSDAEPLVVSSIEIQLVTSASSIDAFKVYDHDGRFLGNASKIGSGRYRLGLKSKDFIIPKEIDYSFYVRALARSHDQGGVSGQHVQIDTFTVEGTGEWSSRSRTESTSELYPVFETARAVFDEIVADGSESALLQGPGQEVASFRFSGKLGDPSAHLEIQSLTLRIEQSGGVTLANARLATPETSDTLACSITSTDVECTAIPASFGAVNGQDRILRIFADVTVPSSSANASLRLTISDPGNADTPGSIGWTDDETVFQWVPFDQPVARGPLMRQ